MIWAAEVSGVTGTLETAEELAAMELTKEMAPMVDDAAAEAEASSVQVEDESGCTKLADPRGTVITVNVPDSGKTVAVVK